MVRFRRWTRRVFLFLVLMIVTALGLFIYYRASDFLYYSSYFKIAEIQVLDVPGDLADQLEETKQVRSFHGRNLLLLDTRKVEERVSELPSLANVRAVKRYPNKLLIRARERHAVAIVSAEEMVLIDHEGVLLESIQFEGKNLYDLPFISGVKIAGLETGDAIEDPQLPTAIDLLGRIKAMNSQLYEKISEITLDQQDGMSLVLTGGIEVRFGRRNPVELMPYLEEFLRSKTDLQGPAVVDLRFKDQLIYR